MAVNQRHLAQDLARLLQIPRTVLGPKRGGDQGDHGDRGDPGKRRGPRGQRLAKAHGLSFSTIGSGSKPAHASTGRTGYFGNRGSSSDLRHSQNTDPRRLEIWRL